MFYKPTHLKLYTCLLFFIGFNSYVKSQVLVDVIFVGDTGIVQTAKEAHQFVALKKFPDGRFQRIDYKMFGPIKMLRTYSDSTLAMLDGRYLEYDASGVITLRGQYADNTRDGEWYHLNDTGKVIRTERYNRGVLEDGDVKDTEPKDTTVYGDEREATFNKKAKAWQNYLMKNTDSEAGLKSAKGGQVIVNFMIDKAGLVTDVYVSKSVEFVLDEAALQPILSSPAWIPAFQNGHAVNAYRRQPFGFVK